MWKNIGLDKCKSLIQSEFIPKSVNVGKPPGPTVTISRMTGAGGHTVASALAYYLQENTPGHPRWTIFDQNLVEKALEDHHMQKYVTDFMEERHTSMIMDSVEEWMGLHPSTWTVVQWMKRNHTPAGSSGPRHPHRSGCFGYRRQGEDGFSCASGRVSRKKESNG